MATTATLRLQSQQWSNENSLYESLINEATNIHGDDFLYMPREFVAKTKILGEDRLSKFTSRYEMIMYLETVEGFEGSGAVMSKFGLQFDEQATVSIPRRTWDESRANDTENKLGIRPNEGDLIYWPRVDCVFEVMFVEHLSPFYQLGKLYTYELTIEKFRYGGEVIQTGIAAVDTRFENMQVTVGKDVTKPMHYGDNKELATKAAEFVFDQNNPFGDL